MENVEISLTENFTNSQVYLRKIKNRWAVPFSNRKIQLLQMTTIVQQQLMCIEYLLYVSQLPMLSISQLTPNPYNSPQKLSIILISFMKNLKFGSLKSASNYTVYIHS